MNIPEDRWDIFDALTCEHPMLADIEDWMLQPYPKCLPDYVKQGYSDRDYEDYRDKQIEKGEPW